MAQETTVDTSVKQIWMFIGRRTEDGKSVAYVWLDDKGEERAFTKKIVGHEWVGARFEMPVIVKDDGRVSVIGTKARYLGPTEDSDVMRDWKARDEAANLAVEARRRAERDAKDENPLRADLEKIRAIYRRVPTPQKRALLAYVISIITE